MFEQATRLKLRFNYKGVLSVEDLWDLSLQALDWIYKDLNDGLRALSQVGLLEQSSDEEDVTRLKVNIVEHVFKAKQAEQQERELAADRAAKKQRLLEIIALKQDEQLQAMSVGELNALVAEL